MSCDLSTCIKCPDQNSNQISIGWCWKGYFIWPVPSNIEEKICPDIFIYQSIFSAESAELAVSAKTSLIQTMVQSE